MKITIAALMIFSALVGSTASAADKAKSKRSVQVTAEQRQDMAAVHEKMAACLRSDKPFEDCQKEMMQSCHSMMGNGGCPMMGQMGKMRGMMNGGMMGDEMMNKSRSMNDTTQPEDTKKQGE